MNAKAQKQLFGEPVLSTRYRDPYKRVLFPRATLYSDIIELTGYTTAGPFMKRVNLRYVEWVEWKHGSKHDANLILWFSTGDTFRLRVESAGLWKYEIEARVRELTGRFLQGKRPSIYRLLQPANETPARFQDSMGLIPNQESLVENVETAITQINEVEYELSVSAGAEELNPEIDKSIRSQRGKVNLKGFRPGKVPFSMVKNLVGEAIAFEYIEKRILETYESEVLEPDSYDVIGMPNITELEYKLDGDLSAKLRFGVRPNFELADLSKVTIPKVVHQVEDSEIDDQIQKLRLDRADLRTRDEGGIEDSDWVKIDLQHLDRESNTPIIGDREEGVSFFMDDEKLKDELKEALLGKKAGDSFHVNLPMEENEDPAINKGNEEAAPLEPYEVTVKEVQIRELPDLDDEFVKEVTRDEVLGKEGFRDYLKKSIEESWNRQTSDILQGEFRLKLLELHEFPVPEMQLTPG